MTASESRFADSTDLARGFAAHARAWALARGASAESAKFIAVAAEQLSLATAAGHVCLPPGAFAGDVPDVGAEELRQRILDSRIVSRPTGAEVLPLVLDGADRLYLRRYFDYERRLAKALVRRAAARTRDHDLAAVSARLDALFAANRKRLGERPDWQRRAVELAMERRLAVVSGGPGTGKTTLVAMLLACLLEAKPDARVALAAPTGKAAARMLEGLRAAPLPENVRALLPQEAHTIHRLLGVTGEAGRFVHDAANPLALDLLVVDEASMLDLSLAAHLMDAVPESARLVFLGDKDQLAAVETGSVFADLSAKGDSPLAGAVVWLTESHRFAADSGIGRLAADINAGEADRALAWLRAGDSGVAWIEDAGAALSSEARQHILAGYVPYLEALRARMDDTAAVFRAFERFRVLCAVRDGARGANELNRLLGAHTRAALDHALDPGGRSPWYPGRPVMVTKNDYLLRLFNGDIGICLPGAGGGLIVSFPDRRGGHRDIAPGRLPEVEDAWASTVHKAQGSEFDTLMCVLPEKAGPVMVRELLYTAVTRARSRVTLAGNAEVFRAACLRQTERHAGLIDRMREADAVRVV